MTMADQARAALAQHDATGKIAKLRLAAARRSTLEAEVARAEGQITSWDRVVFFRDSRAQASARVLRTELARSQAEYDAALAAWTVAIERAGACYAPITAAAHIERVIHAVLDDRRVGRNAKETRTIATALDGIAEWIAGTWAPSVSLRHLELALADDAVRHAASQRDPGPLARCLSFGWTRVSPEELFCRVARSLEASVELRNARAALAREGAEAVAVATQLEQAEQGVTLLDRLVPGAGPREKQVQQLRDQFERERSDAQRAEDWVRLAVIRAFSAHPVFGLYVALLGAGAAARACRPRREAMLTRSGKIGHVRSAAQRASLLASLVEVRRACDAAFPGVREVVWPPPGPASASPGAEVSAGGPMGEHYRAPGVRDEEPTAPEARPPDPHAAFAAAVEGLGLRQILASAVQTATILGILEHDLGDVSAGITWIDRLAFWSNTEAEAAARNLSDRTAFYRDALERLGDQSVGTVERAAEYHFELALGRHLQTAVRTVVGLATVNSHATYRQSCPVLGKDSCLGAIARARAAIHHHRGPHASEGDYQSHIEALLERTRAPIQAPAGTGPLTHDDVVRRCAAFLQQTAYMQLMHERRAFDQQRQAARAREHAARAQVNTWEKINVLHDSLAERDARRWRDDAERAEREVETRSRIMGGLMYQALEQYPTIVLEAALGRAAAAVEAVSATSERRTSTDTTRDGNGKVISTSTSTYYVCVLHGAPQAQRQVSDVASRAQRLFGGLPSAGDVLERWVKDQL